MTGREKWAGENWKRQIVDERKYMWYEEQIDRLAAAMNLMPGMTIVDVGCGLGYLGWTYWRHFGNGGTYFGVDCSFSLLKEAEEVASIWSSGGIAGFVNGDSYSLPMADGSSDVTMCQTLLTHLEHPEKALNEMIRITKPGGLIVCKELDNISHFMKLGYSSVTEHEEFDEILCYRRMRLLLAAGRKELGFGDLGIGSRVPGMMHRAALTEIKVFANERLEFLIPPYEDPQQKQRVKIMSRHTQENTEEEKEKEKGDCRKYYIAGGGDPDSFEHDYEKLLEIAITRQEKMKEQVKNKTMFACSGGSNFFCVFGRKAPTESDVNVKESKDEKSS